MTLNYNQRITANQIVNKKPECLLIGHQAARLAGRRDANQLRRISMSLANHLFKGVVFQKQILLERRAVASES